MCLLQVERIQSDPFLTGGENQGRSGIKTPPTRRCFPISTQVAGSVMPWETNTMPDGNFKPFRRGEPAHGC